MSSSFSFKKLQRPSIPTIPSSIKELRNQVDSWKLGTSSNSTPKLAVESQGTPTLPQFSQQSNNYNVNNANQSPMIVPPSQGTPNLIYGNTTNLSNMSPYHPTDDELPEDMVVISILSLHNMKRGASSYLVGGKTLVSMNYNGIQRQTKAISVSITSPVYNEKFVFCRYHNQKSIYGNVNLNIQTNSQTLHTGNKSLGMINIDLDKLFELNGTDVIKDTIVIDPTGSKFELCYAIYRQSLNTTEEKVAVRTLSEQLNSINNEDIDVYGHILPSIWYSIPEEDDDSIEKDTIKQFFQRPTLLKDQFTTHMKNFGNLSIAAK